MNGLRSSCCKFGSFWKVVSTVCGMSETGTDMSWLTLVDESSLLSLKRSDERLSLEGFAYWNIGRANCLFTTQSSSPVYLSYQATAALNQFAMTGVKILFSWTQENILWSSSTFPWSTLEGTSSAQICVIFSTSSLWVGSSSHLSRIKLPSE